MLCSGSQKLIASGLGRVLFVYDDGAGKEKSKARPESEHELMKGIVKMSIPSETCRRMSCGVDTSSRDRRGRWFRGPGRDGRIEVSWMTSPDRCGRISSSWRSSR